MLGYLALPRHASITVISDYALNCGISALNFHNSTCIHTHAMVILNYLLPVLIVELSFSIVNTAMQVEYTV